eukprot:3444414-Pyramimonas_sp.AAC.1
MAQISSLFAQSDVVAWHSITWHSTVLKINAQHDMAWRGDAPTWERASAAQQNEGSTPNV